MASKIKMRATRRHFHKVEGRDVEAGETFDVADENEAGRLIRRGKAVKDDGKAKVVSAPTPTSSPRPAVTRAMRAEDTGPQAAQPQLGGLQASEASSTAVAPMTTEDASGLVGEPTRRRYSRRDLRSED